MRLPGQLCPLPVDSSNLNIASSLLSRSVQVDVDALLWEINQSLEARGAGSPVPFPVFSSPAGSHQTPRVGSATSSAVSAAGARGIESASPLVPAISAGGAPASPQPPVLSIGNGQTGGWPLCSSSLEQQASGSDSITDPPTLEASNSSGEQITSPASARVGQDIAASTPAAAPASWLFASQQEQQQQWQTPPDAEVVASMALTTSRSGVLQQLSPKTKDFVRQAYVAREAQMVQLATRPLPVQGTSLNEARAQTARWVQWCPCHDIYYLL